MTIFQWLHQTFRCCLHCGSFQCGSSQFCSSCENDLWRAHNHLQIFDLGLDYYRCQGLALFDWYPNHDRKVSKLMVTLKGGKLRSSFEYYAQSFVGRLDQKIPPNSVLVPCPARSDRKHSQAFAESLSRLLELPLQDTLVKEGSSSQKSKGKAARSKIRISNQTDYSDKHVIFIDDIVTTGATALSARNAIGPCRSFQVWCLAHRRQLAAYSSF